MKKTILCIFIYLLSGCVVVTIKENHTHIHHNTGDVVSDEQIKGSDLDDTLNGSGNPNISLPIP